MSENNQSEIARLRKRIADEYNAAEQVLTGFAYGAAKHSFITARMEHIGSHHEVLKRLVGESEATRIMAETMEELSWQAPMMGLHTLSEKSAHGEQRNEELWSRP